LHHVQYFVNHPSLVIKTHKFLKKTVNILKGNTNFKNLFLPNFMSSSTDLLMNGTAGNNLIVSLMTRSK
jgi:hypothetical protein